MKHFAFFSRLAVTPALLAGMLLAGCTSPVEVTSVGIEEDELRLVIGESAALTVEVSPADAISLLEWESSNPDVAIVDDGGLVVSVSQGEAEISVTAGSFSDVCKVIVTGVPATGITLNAENLQLFTGETAALTAEVFPDDTEDKTVSWSSSAPEVATVDESGLVTALTAGETVITASCGEYQATCNVSVAMMPAKIGDYYYSDGTYSTELDGSKEVIGVVFYVGDPTVNDPTLAREHPDCVNGLVLSLTGDEQMAWQENYWDWTLASDYDPDAYVGKWIEENAPEYLTITTYTGLNDNVNMILGYNNTKAIEAFNAAPENSGWPVNAVEHVVSYRDEVAAPEASSDWYLPSPKELSLICTGEWLANIYEITGTEVDMRNELNSVLATIDGAQLLSETDTYMTSSEDEWGSGTFIVYFWDGGVSYSSKGDTSLHARPVLAF